MTLAKSAGGKPLVWEWRRLTRSRFSSFKNPSATALSSQLPTSLMRHTMP
jgi:hypothetical protein